MIDTGEVVEFDVGLGTVGIKFSVRRVELNCLSEEVDGEFIVVVYEGFFGLRCQIGRHSRGREIAKKVEESRKRVSRYSGFCERDLRI